MRRFLLAALMTLTGALFSDFKSELIAIEDQLADLANLARQDPRAEEIQERLDQIVKMADTSAKFKEIEDTLLSVVAQNEEGDKLEDRISQMQDDLDTLKAQLSAIVKQNSVKECGVELSPARPCHGDGFFVSLAYLYWQAFATEAEYCYSYEPVSSDSFPGDLLRNGESQLVKFGAKSGIRAGLGWTLPHDGWEIGLIYTYMSPVARQTTHARGAHLLFPSWAYQPIADSVSATRAEAYWRIRYQTLDLELGKAFFVSPKVILRPHGAARGGWIDQAFHIDYSGGEIAAVIPDYRIEGTNDFQGGGARIGFDTTWFLGYGFHLFNDLAASLLFGSFNVSQKHLSDSTTLAKLVLDRARMTPSADMQLGLGWQIWFNQARNRFRLRLSYEMQYWWNQSAASHYVDSTLPIALRVSNDIGFQGLTIEGRMDF